MLCRIVFNAPRGSLGIWVDDSSNNLILNVVSNVKTDGPSVGKVLIGDQIIKVNDVDVRRRSAPEITNLIEQHHNDEKTITIARSLDKPKSHRQGPVDTDFHVEVGEEVFDDDDCGDDDTSKRKEDGSSNDEGLVIIDDDEDAPCMTYAAASAAEGPVSDDTIPRGSSEDSDAAIKERGVDIIDDDEDAPLVTFVAAAMGDAESDAAIKKRAWVNDNEPMSSRPNTTSSMSDSAIRRRAWESLNTNSSRITSDQDVRSERGTNDTDDEDEEMADTEVPIDDAVSVNSANTERALRPDTTTSEPATLYEVPEAHLVRPSDITDPILPVYDAEPMPKLPFWKRNARGVIVSVILVFLVITGTIIGILLPLSKRNGTPTPSPTSPPYLYDSCASYIGPLLEDGCEGCSPPVEINVNDTLAAIKKDSINFFSHSDGGIMNVTTLDIDYNVVSTAISGNTAVVGAPQESSFRGAVYVYEKDSFGVWSQTDHIFPEELGDGSQFGRYVDIDNDTMVVGSYDYTGSVYVYRRIDGIWVNETKLEPKRSTNKDFSKTVKVKGNRIAVGDRLFGWKPEGAVFLYEYNETSNDWVELLDNMGVISNEDCAGRFGVHFYLAGEHEIMVGCPKDDDWTGSVYYYSRAEQGKPYELRQRIQASDGTNGNRFGQTEQIDVDGDIMTIGQYREAGGKAHVYVRTDAGDGWYNWTEVTSIPAPPKAAEEEGLYFSDQLALSGSRVVISDSDNAYLYDLERCLPGNRPANQNEILFE